VFWPLVLTGQQIPQYSHYLLNGLLVNPAYTGYREHLYAQLFYHNQWMRSAAPQYLAFAIDGHLAKGVNLGLQFSRESLGAVAINNLLASYAYRFQLTRNSDLSFGLAVGATHYGLNFNELRPFDNNDPLLQNLSGKWIPAVDAGVYYGSDFFSAGFSVRNITSGNNFGTHKVDDFLIPVSTWHSVLTLNMSLPVTAAIDFRPALMWQEDFTTPSHIDLTAALLFVDRYWVGMSFRTDQHFWKPEVAGSLNELYSLALLAEVFITNQLTFSYAFDVGLNSLSKSYFGGHEISVGYYITRKIDERFNRKLRYKKYTLLKGCYCP
jgi:type IX secretion system PorP/SprF family membrane protein